MTATTDEPPVNPEEFGGNEWIVEEMYRRYLDAPKSVSRAWQEYFADAGWPEPQRRSDHVAAPTPLPVPPTPDPTEGPPAARPTPAAPVAGTAVELRGAPATIARRMEESRELPTATSVRTLPAKLLEVNRTIINNQLARRDGGKVSFTHIIGWAVIQALQARPALNAAYQEIDAKPHRIQFEHVNLGLAMDIARKDGTRTLLVPSINHAEQMAFAEYREAYEDIVDRVRTGAVTPDDFAGTTATLTNPGTVGTVQSVPRLMPGQGVIVGVGAIGYPPEYEGADPTTLASQGVGRTLTVTSTYDHRVIQGAESGLFLQRIHELLLGAHGFYDTIFAAMGIPYVPARWAADRNPPPGSREWAEKQATVFQLINMYRVRGHLIADLDPLRQRPPTIHPELDPITYGLTIWDLDRSFATGGLGGRTRMQLGDILGTLRDAYGRTIGVEYMHIQEPEEKLWIQEHAEGGYPPVDREARLRILEKLEAAEAFERFCHTKFLGAKRFSLEGSESLIPLLDRVLHYAADDGMRRAVIGMAHRGRLNVLANIVGKNLSAIFGEFAGDAALGAGDHSGDVKYHLGAQGTHTSLTGLGMDVEVVANPSHLEAVDPVLEGVARAQQDQQEEPDVDLILPVLLHGDAAFAGQGVVAETFNLSQLEAYHTGGTIHVVINNQVGFTTPVVDARSSHYATDVAKIVQAPIFHVNGDDPIAVAQVAELAFFYRQAFHKDIVIDLVTYRRLGHNEGDEPTYTQPVMYRTIEEQRPVRELFGDRLLAAGDLTADEAEELAAAYRHRLDAALAAVGVGHHATVPDTPEMPPPTALPEITIGRIDERLRTIPDGFTPHPKLAKILQERTATFDAGSFDWGLAEAFAFGSLALEGTRVRLVGEDSKRGTFSHRHAVLVDHVTEEEYAPLADLAADQAPVQVFDSLLSEFAAMGFEYGYSIGDPDALVIWEAQFGDFVNGAQVIIDQFLTTGLDKWARPSALTLLLPHGFEGQGAEHSSARMERFLAAAAEDNVRVVVPSTTAQLFHVLRRQALWTKRRPLIVMSPKSLLRTRASFSRVEELGSGSFSPVIADTTVTAGARRVLLCTGKIAYELESRRDATGIDDVAIVRVEELYPLATEGIDAALAAHPDAELCWIQEEPANMGAWRFMSRALFVAGGWSSRGIYRTESASPATGIAAVHAAEQEHLLTAAFA